MSSLPEITQAALALPESDRVTLVETLIATIEPEHAAPLNDAWHAEVERRVREIDEGKVTLIPWKTVLERLGNHPAHHGNSERAILYSNPSETSR